MESLQVRTGQISLQILDDLGNERGVFKFNPEDVAAAKRFFSIQDEFDMKSKEFNARVSELENSGDTERQIDLLNEIVEYLNSLIDECFGSGSSDLLFGGAKTLSMYYDFFTGITPYYQQASEKRMEKYNKK